MVSIFLKNNSLTNILRILANQIQLIFICLKFWKSHFFFSFGKQKFRWGEVTPY